jgi:hypothetical protein
MIVCRTASIRAGGPGFLVNGGAGIQRRSMLSNKVIIIFPCFFLLILIDSLFRIDSSSRVILFQAALDPVVVKKMTAV